MEKPSYYGILFKHLEEGNNCPIFYIVQKAIGDLTHYKFPGPWKGEWQVKDMRSQIIMRIQANIFSALTIALIFYFFARYYSLAAGAYALLVTLSSFMIWAYWVDARPYSIWVFLTTVQCLLVLCIIGEKDDERRNWRWLMITHLFLSFTVIMSIVQVVVVSVVLWLFKDRNWKRYIGLTIIPSLISIFYYSRAIKFQFSFPNTPIQLIGASIPKDRVLILVLYAVFLGGYYLYEKNKTPRIKDKLHKEGTAFLVLTMLMLLSAIVVIIRCKMSLVHGRIGFPVSNRHVIYLTPIGIIAVTLFSIHFYRTFADHKWARILMILAFCGLLIFRVIRTYGQLQGLYIS